MWQRKSRDELIGMVQRLIEADLPGEEEDRLVEELKSSVSHPRVTDLIYYNTPELTAEEVVDKALAYRPIEL
ncbi:bacteriocin immunity protein [Streptomyces sp. BYX5S]